MGWFGIIRGHSRSLEIAPFDRAHSPSIASMSVSFTVSEIYWYIGQNSLIVMYPPLLGAPVGSDPNTISILQRSLASENWSPWATVWRCLHDPTFSHFGFWYNTGIWQMDGYTTAYTALAWHCAVKTTQRHRKFHLTRQHKISASV